MGGGTAMIGDPSGKHKTVGTCIGRIGVRKQLADVPQRRRAEQGVHHGMDKHIRVGMSQQSVRVGDGHPAEDQRPSLRQPVDVIPVTDPERTRRHAFLPRRRARMASARRRSSGVVILTLSLWHSTICTR